MATYTNLPGVLNIQVRRGEQLHGHGRHLTEFHGTMTVIHDRVIGTGQGMEGEITSTAPYRRRAAVPPQGSSPVATPPPGSAPAATVLILGDSLSAEYGIARGKGWVALLSAKLQAERPDVNVINASISGDTRRNSFL